MFSYKLVRFESGIFRNMCKTCVWLSGHPQFVSVQEQLSNCWMCHVFKRNSFHRKLLREAAPLRAPPVDAEHMLRIRSCLAQLQLSQYADIFERHGYDDYDLLKELDEDQLLGVAHDIEMKKGHAHKFAQRFLQTEPFVFFRLSIVFNCFWWLLSVFIGI